MRLKLKEDFNISIEVGIATSFIVLVLFTSISLSLFISSSVKQTMREDLQKQLHNVVSVGSLVIQGDELDLLVDQSQENSPAYLNVKKQLQAVRDSSLNIRHVYTMRMGSNQSFYFIVDAEESLEEMSHLGEEYPNPTELQRKIFTHPSGAYVESVFNTDQWGTWLSGYAPIFNSQGELAGIIGADISADDSIMAFWGAPDKMDNHALLACEAALDCQRFLQDFNKEMLAKRGYQFTTRIGIHTGEMLVGNIGAENRLNYTVIGDPVNVASRLEGLNKNYGTQILISEDTYNRVKDKMLTRLVDTVTVKGKNTEMVIYELLDRKR